MSIWKSLADPAPSRAAPRNSKRDPDDTSAKRSLQDVEITSLEVDDDYDGGNDPYNRTGQFFVLQLKEKDRR